MSSLCFIGPAVAAIIVGGFFAWGIIFTEPPFENEEDAKLDHSAGLGKYEYKPEFLPNTPNEVILTGDCVVSEGCTLYRAPSVKKSKIKKKSKKKTKKSK